MNIMNAGQLIAEITNRPPTYFDPATSFSKLAGWDSLKTVRLVLRVEELIKRQLTDDELEALLTVGDLERLLNIV